MSYDEDLADRIRMQLGAAAGLTEKRMFGGVAFLINGNLAVSASGRGGMLLRCDPAQTDALLDPPAVRRFEMRGREMNGWLRVDPSAVTSAAHLEGWIRVGVAYASSLPGK